MNNLATPGGVKILTVSEITRQVKGMIEDAFPAVWVGGEITGLKKHHSGHWYFSLKDAGAVLPSAMFRNANMRTRVDPKDGMEVIARGSLQIYAPQGKYQLIVEELVDKGLGAQELALQKLKEKLLQKGYFAPQRKRALPAFPSAVALVTSPTGAAIRDMLEILGRRWPAARVLVCPVRVQGATAAKEIAEALALVNRVRGADVVILGRGGGSMEDLSAFNDERVADAVFQSAIPVVAAIGHEIDVTIADLVADKRALTPSEAAELVTPDAAGLLKKAEDFGSRLRELLWGRLELARSRLAELADRRVFRRPLDRVQEASQRADGLGERLQRAIRVGLERRGESTQAFAARLETLSPLNVLSRGYSLTRRATDQKVLRSADQVQPGDVLITMLQHGQVTSRTMEIALPKPN